MENGLQTPKLHLRGIILDMDGVLTDTRELHFLAWKSTFDKYLSGHGFIPGFSRDDYQKYVDGKVREEGISSFLASRQLHFSSLEIVELGTQKNETYLELLKEADSIVFDEVKQTLSDWKTRNIQMALITSSKNAEAVLEKAQLSDYFSVIIDRSEAEKLHLDGKPAPDYFLEAAKRLGLRPDECAIVEDSLAGMEAGVRGGFHDVVGISRKGQTPPVRLIEAGADYVVPSLTEVAEIPNALSHWSEIELKLKNLEPILFLDYDGTLTEIVENPVDAVIPLKMQDLLKHLSKGIKIVITSGRDLADVRKRVGIENIFYVGCHGLEMSGPGCFHFSVDELNSLLPELQLVTMEAMTRLSHIPGVHIERKKFSTAIHYRQTPPGEQDSVKEIVKEVSSRNSRIKVKPGKKVFELLPNTDWDKGSSYKKVLGLLASHLSYTLPIYIGDDETDEDVFRLLGHNEIGIRVDATRKVSTSARYNLSSPSEVFQFLQLIDVEFNGTEKRWTLGH